MRRSQGATSRPRRALLGAVALTLLLLGLAAPAAAQKAYVANWTDESVSVIDTATDQVLGEPIPVGDHPNEVAISPDGSAAYVVNSYSNSVSVIDTATDRPLGPPIPLGGDPYGVAISPDGSRAYVPILGQGIVSVIDTATGRPLAKSIPVGEGPMRAALSPDGRTLYVVNADSEDVSVIDTATDHQLHSPIEVGQYPVGLAITPDGRKLYVANNWDGSISVIDTATDQTVGGEPIHVGESPGGLAITPDGNRLYVPNEGSGTVSVIDTATDQTVGEIPTASPTKVALTADGSKAYVTSADSGTVSVIDTATGIVTKTISEGIGGKPGGIAIVPDQPPIAALAPVSGTVGTPLRFDASASADPDGAIAAFDWHFGDGHSAFDAGPTPSHTYAVPGTYHARVTLTDDQGCSTKFVFTGQTAYCNGSAVAERTVDVSVAAKPRPKPPKHTTNPPRHVVDLTPPGPSNEFLIRRLRHNLRNGTVRMRLWMPGAGSVRLRGPRVRPVWRKVGGAQGLTLVVRPRRMLNLALKHRRRHARVRVWVTFTPAGGTARTRTKGLTLRRRAHTGHRVHASRAHSRWR